MKVFPKPIPRPFRSAFYFFENDEPGRQDGAKAMFADLLIQNPVLLEYVLCRLRFYKDHLFNMFSLLCGMHWNKLAKLFVYWIVWTTLKKKPLVKSRPYVDVERAFHSEIEDVALMDVGGEDESEKISDACTLARSSLVTTTTFESLIQFVEDFTVFFQVEDHPLARGGKVDRLCDWPYSSPDVCDRPPISVSARRGEGNPGSALSSVSCTATLISIS